MDVTKSIRPGMNRFVKGRSSVSNPKPSIFAGLMDMTMLSDKKDILQSSFFNSSYSKIENSLEFLKTTQNEIYGELNKEVDELRLENNELKLKLVFLSNSPDILTTFPPIDDNMITKKGGVEANMLSHHIEELQIQIAKEVEKNKHMEEKIIKQQNEITALKSQLPNFKDLALLGMPKISQSTLTDNDIAIKWIPSLRKVSSYNLYSEDPSMPTTIRGCHSMIISLIKARDKVDREMKILNRKLRNIHSPPYSNNFNSHNVSSIRYKSLSIQMNNSYPKRRHFLPPMYREDDM